MAEPRQITEIAQREAALFLAEQSRQFIEAYLSAPYKRCVTPDADGSYRAEIAEFPGCIATGDTSADALANLEEVARSWLEGSLEKGLTIPAPLVDDAVIRLLGHHIELLEEFG